MMGFVPQPMGTLTRRSMRGRFCPPSPSTISFTVEAEIVFMKMHHLFRTIYARVVGGSALCCTDSSSASFTDFLKPLMALPIPSLN